MSIFRKKEDVLTGEVVEKKAKRLAIVGFSPSSAMHAFELPIEGTEIWILNNFYDVMQGMRISLDRVSALFDIHDRRNNRNLSNNTQAGQMHLQVLSKLTCDVYMQDTYDDVPNAKKFPADKVANFFFRRFGMRPYFTSTPTWLMAYAVYLGFLDKDGNETDKWNGRWDEIHLYGVDMAAGWSRGLDGHDAIGNEYANQRPSCEWIIGVIMGLQIAGVPVKFYLPKESNLMQINGLYGYETEDEAIMKKQIMMKVNLIQSVEQQIAEEERSLQGRLADLNNQKTQIIGEKRGYEFALSYFNDAEKEELKTGTERYLDGVKMETEKRQIMNQLNYLQGQLNIGQAALATIEAKEKEGTCDNG